MMIRRFRLLLFLVLLILSSLACGLLSQVTDPVADVIDEAQQIATQVGDITTQVSIEELSTTMEAFATEMPIEGLQATAEAVTEGLQPGEAPPDIPVVAETSNLYTSKDLVSFTTSLPYDQVVDFYKEQMPLNEWLLAESGNVESPSASILNFDKPQRRAIVTISANPLNAETVVLITITAR